MTAFLVIGILTVVWGVCQYFAQGMAINRARSPKLWGGLAAFFGPIALAVLAVLPARNSRHA